MASNLLVPLGYPDYPATGLRETSAEAAYSIAPKVPHLRGIVLEAIRQKPRTCAELEVDLGLSHQTCSPRVTELFLKDQIEESGEFRKTPLGRKAIVWKARDG